MAAMGGGGVANVNGEDLMSQYGLWDVLKELRARKLRSSFLHYITELSSDVVPLKPRCTAGGLKLVALQPVNEDERRLEEFDERVLRNGLALKESGEEKVELPKWLDDEQSWEGEDERKKRRKERRKKKKKKKRKRTQETGEGVSGPGGPDEDDEKRARKKKK